jgi:hypothetical protein
MTLNSGRQSIKKSVSGGINALLPLVKKYIGHPYLFDPTRAREQLIRYSDTPYYHCISRVDRKPFSVGLTEVHNKITHTDING